MSAQPASTGTPSRGPAGRMDDASVRRAVLVALGTAASSVFALIDYTPLAFVTMPNLAVVILLVAAGLTVAAALIRRAEVVVAVGVVLLLLGLVRLMTYGHGSGLIGGQSSTAALLAGLGVALLGIGVLVVPDRVTSLSGTTAKPGPVQGPAGHAVHLLDVPA